MWVSVIASDIIPRSRGERAAPASLSWWLGRFETCQRQRRDGSGVAGFSVIDPQHTIKPYGLQHALSSAMRPPPARTSGQQALDHVATDIGQPKSRPWKRHVPLSWLTWPAPSGWRAWSGPHPVAPLPPGRGAASAYKRNTEPPAPTAFGPAARHSRGSRDLPGPAGRWP
jgi:hypothetical protein